MLSPIRSFFVKSKVEKTFDLTQYRALSWLRKETLGRFGLSSLGFGRTRSGGAVTGIEKEREEARVLLTSWLNELPDGFVTITGPRGSGKGPLVDSVMKDRPCVHLHFQFSRTDWCKGLDMCW